MTYWVISLTWPTLCGVVWFRSDRWEPEDCSTEWSQCTCSWTVCTSCPCHQTKDSWTDQTELRSNVWCSVSLAVIWSETTRSLELTRWQLLAGYRWYAVWPLNIISYYTNWKPIYDFYQNANPSFCHLSVCNVHAVYSVGWNVPQRSYAIL